MEALLITLLFLCEVGSTSISSNEDGGGRCWRFEERREGIKLSWRVAKYKEERQGKIAGQHEVHWRTLLSESDKLDCVLHCSYSSVKWDKTSASVIGWLGECENSTCLAHSIT